MKSNLVDLYDFELNILLWKQGIAGLNPATSTINQKASFIEAFLFCKLLYEVLYLQIIGKFIEMNLRILKLFKVITLLFILLPLTLILNSLMDSGLIFNVMLDTLNLYQIMLNLLYQYFYKMDGKTFPLIAMNQLVIQILQIIVLILEVIHCMIFIYLMRVLGWLFLKPYTLLLHTQVDILAT